MICHLCGKDKLSKEFPHGHLTDDCIKHPLLHCLRVSTVFINIYARYYESNFVIHLMIFAHKENGHSDEKRK